MRPEEDHTLASLEERQWWYIALRWRGWSEKAGGAADPCGCSLPAAAPGDCCGP